MGASGTTGTGGSKTGAGGSAGIGGGGAAGRGGGAAGGSSGGTGGGGRGGSGATTGSGGNGGGATGTGGGPAPTFTEIYKTILTVYCAGSNCHIPGSQNGLSFSTQAVAYKSLLSLAVIPGDSGGSGLYTNLATGAMPFNEPMLSDAQIAEVAAWIDAGAKNN
jgi:hypothetical protein